MSSRSGRDWTCASKPWLLVRWSAVLQFNVVLEVLAADRGQRRWDLAGGEPADLGALRRCSPRHVSSRGSAPSPEAPDVVVQHQELQGMEPSREMKRDVDYIGVMLRDRRSEEHTSELQSHVNL